MIYTIAVCTAKTPDDGQRNCPKHVEFYSKNKFEKLVHLVRFIIRMHGHLNIKKKTKFTLEYTLKTHSRVEISLYSLFNLGSRWGWVVKAM